MNLDPYKLIQSGGDGGDTLHRMYTFGLRLLLNFRLCIDKGVPLSPTVRSPEINQVASMERVQELLEVEPGIYRRHPDSDFWGSDPRNVSRDQLVPVIGFLAYLSSRGGDLGKTYRTHLKNLLKQCLKRGMLAQNIYPNWVDARRQQVAKKFPDPLTPDLWATFARGWVNTWFFPLAIPVIIFGDFFLMLSAMFKVWAPLTKDGTLEFRKPKPDDVDDDNMNTILMVAMFVYPTPFSYLARKIYKKFRAPNLGNTELGEKSPIMGALAYYHRAPLGNPELMELARPIVERY